MGPAQVRLNVAGFDGLDVITSFSTDAVAFSTDSKIIVSSGNDFLTYWSAITGKNLHSFKPDSASSLKFSPDGKKLFLGMASDDAKIIDFDFEESSRKICNAIHTFLDP